MRMPEMRGERAKRFLQAYVDLFFAIVSAFRSPRVQALMTTFLLIAAVQALVFTWVEDWRFLDAFYFAVVSMATVGYGDFAPESPLGKVLDILFLLSGIGIFVLTVSSIAEAILRELRLAEHQKGQSGRSGRAKPGAREAGK